MDSRINTILSLAISKATLPQIKDWLRTDAKNTWKLHIAVLLAETEHTAKEKHLTQEQVNAEIALYIVYLAVCAVITERKNYHARKI